ncbi:MAG: imidazole glycerol phosphate synthase subunit HisH [Candidatus Aminicenantes bacterium]|nr:imidazole glycerol phosphate synthase subunit HisH [Candidatus Aminicenantes bacterium]
MIGVIDYGAGNLNSVLKALAWLNLPARLVSSPEDAATVEKLIIPGVGSFGAALSELRKRNLYQTVDLWIKENRPLLGICLGFQLLFQRSEESPEEHGFSIFQGICQKIKASKVPHMGWNKVKFVQPDPLFTGLPLEEYFYFVHSYAVFQTNGSVLGLTDYGNQFVSVIKSGRIYGVQFHPEKSGQAGLQLLQNWGTKC